METQNREKIEQLVGELHPLEIKLLLSFQWLESQTNDELIKKSGFELQNEVESKGILFGIISIFIEKYFIKI